MALVLELVAAAVALVMLTVLSAFVLLLEVLSLGLDVASSVLSTLCP